MLRFFNPSRGNVIATTQELLKLLNVKVSDGTVSRALQEHPDYPSLLSISDSLSLWKVTSKGFKITSEQLLGLPLPLTAHLKSNKLVLVTNITEETVMFINDRNKKEITSIDSFTKQWDGVVLFAEAGSQSGEARYAEKHRLDLIRQAKIPALFLLATLLIILNGIGSHNLLGGIFSGIMLIGSLITGLLLLYEIDRQNPVLHKICTTGRNTNCSAVLQSNAARLWGILSWSEIGFVYFTGSLGSMLLSGLNPAVIGIIAWFNLLALPYVFFSVYYQWRVAKQWCILCLSVQALLLTGFTINLSVGNYMHSIHTLSVWELTVLFFSFLSPLLIWTIAKPILITAKKSKQHKLALQRLKHDNRIFEALLPKQKMITENPRGLGITLGNPMAKTKLIKVCNPYCGPCARAHPEIEAIIENNTEIQAQIIFTARDDEKDIKSKPTKHLMAIDEKGDSGLTRQALDDWYLAPQKDYTVFAKKYPLNKELLRQGSKLTMMSDWCIKTGISFTPTFFINGYQLPEIYSVQDLKYLLT